jgi:hypothetical protein
MHVKYTGVEWIKLRPFSLCSNKPGDEIKFYRLAYTLLDMKEGSQSFFCVHKEFSKLKFRIYNASAIRFRIFSLHFVSNKRKVKVNGIIT